jgi:hypothetical protein
MCHMFLGGNYDEIAQHVMDKEAIINSLAHALSKFTLKSVEFVEPDRHASSRCTFMSEELRARNEQSVFNTPGARQAAYMGMLTGLDVLLRTLSQAGKSPKRFTFPVPTLWYTGFGTFASQNVLRNVCKVTEELYVRQIQNATLRLRGTAVHPTQELQHPPSAFLLLETPPQAIYHSPGAAEEMFFIDANFPALKHLTIDIGSGVLRPLQSRLLTSLQMVAKVEHLPISQDKSHEVYGVAWRNLTHEDNPLKHFLPTFQHLTLINICTGNWNDFLEHIRTPRRLNKLEAEVESRVWDQGPKECFVCTEERWNKTARIATIEPEELKQKVKDVWYQQKESKRRLEQLDEVVGLPYSDEDDAVGDDKEEEMEDQNAQQ